MLSMTLISGVKWAPVVIICSNVRFVPTHLPLPDAIIKKEEA